MSPVGPHDHATDEAKTIRWIALKTKAPFELTGSNLIISKPSRRKRFASQIAAERVKSDARFGSDGVERGAVLLWLIQPTHGLECEPGCQAFSAAA